MTAPVPVPIEHRGRFARLVADAWGDPQLAERYAAQPHAVLAEYGIDWAPGQPTPALPAEPEDVSLEELGSAAGAAMVTIGTVSCPSACGFAA